MAFIRTKRQGGREYAYVVETYWDRERASPRQRVLAYLGPAGDVRPDAVPPELRGEPAVVRWLRKRLAEGAAPTNGKLEDARAALRSALLAPDWPAAEAAARAALATLGPPAFLESVVTPLLHAIGDDWYAGRVTVADEHLVTRGVAHVLWTLREEMRVETAGGGARVLLANPEDEPHSLALEVLEGRLLAQGHETLVLAGGLPRRDLAARAAAYGPDLVLLSATLPQSAPASLRSAEAVLARCPSAKVAVGGQAWLARPRPAGLDPRVVVAKDDAALDELLARA